MVTISKFSCPNEIWNVMLGAWQILERFFCCGGKSCLIHLYSLAGNDYNYNWLTSIWIVWNIWGIMTLYSYHRNLCLATRMLSPTLPAPSIRFLLAFMKCSFWWNIVEVCSELKFALTKSLVGSCRGKSNNCA